MTILIPAYEPNHRLIKLILKLKENCSADILIVDDGSKKAYRSIFKEAKELGCKVLTHETNRGKGAALKTGFKYILEGKKQEDVIVCADCDGQHLPEDIIRIGAAAKANKGSIVLGTRRFKGKVPFRSLFGNSVTRAVFSFASGVKVYDTQTGLRGFSRDMLPWLCNISGERFEYEMNMLLDAAPSGYGIEEVDIETVYLEQNKSSHFNAFRDSIRVYLPLVKFSISSALSGVLDFFLLGIFQLITSNLFLSVVGARVCSASFNYLVNKFYVFSRFKNSTVKKSIPRYFMLAAIVMFANYGVIHTYNKIIGLSLFFAKVFTEVTIYIFSFWSQRKFVFKN